MLYMLIKYVQCRECGIVAFKKSLKIPKAQSETKLKDGQYDDQKKKDKRTNNDLQSIAQKTIYKDWPTQPHLKPGVNSGAPEG
jgi:hypothetical protein